MITEDYVSFETAKLLKEKGFDENCSRSYVKDKLAVSQGFNNSYYTTMYSDGCYRPISAPTLQMAMKWLREVHKLGVFPTTYYREISGAVRHDYGSTIVRLDSFEIIGNDKNFDDYTFEADTYEETADKAIRYCLENLI